MATSQRAPAPQAPPPSAAPHIGQRYRVIEQLGQGGTAVVYRVRDVSHGRELALKQLSLQACARGEPMRTQFEREYSVLAQLHHPSVVQVHDFGVDAAGPYYTMELLDAGDLGARAPWPYAQACQLLMQICSALSLLHSRSLVHGDISPRNVRITAIGSAKLIDFGAMAGFGRAEQVAGTPGFVAPEIVHRMPLDARTDVFSVGATLYYALTGRPPFAARSLKELAEAWGREPAAPSELARGIPPALDALVLSMLRTDPARRPGSAFEVMQRLAASAAVSLPESDEIARAGLTTPQLIGREAPLRRFRQCLRRAMHEAATGLMIQGASGLGRTRLLDACMVEAKLRGATVLHTAGRAAGAGAFSNARHWALQLLDALPDQALACAAAADLTNTLFDMPETDALPSARLRAFEAAGEDAVQFQTALSQWLSRVSETQTLMIAVDDIEHIDDASLALLITLVHDASGSRLLLVCTAPHPFESDARPALSVLLAQCSTLALSAWTAAETEALFASVFCGAPHVTLVSDRIQKLAGGNPREALALAQHMLDRKLIRFSDGNWCLPAELAVSDLPASAQEALRIRLESLPALPRQLAQAQALALDGRWSRASYQRLAADSGSAQIDEALALLLRSGVISDNAGTYTLSHLSVQACLRAQLTAADRRQHHAALAALCAQEARHVLGEVYHLLQAEDSQRALERLAPLLDGNPTVQELREQSGLELKTIAEILEQAHGQAVAQRRNPRETHELTRILLSLSVVTDSRLYYRQAPACLSQLKRDSGLHDYLAADPRVDPPKRLEQALQSAAARYANTPEPERVYRVDEAIKYLAQYVVISVAVGGRTADITLWTSLAPLLEPFATLSPVLYALWQNAIAVTETAKGQSEQARRRWIEVYERLAPMSERDFPYLAELRGAIAYGIASAEVSGGQNSAEHWIGMMELTPLQHVAAQHLRRALSMFEGDAAAAECHRKQAELLAAQSVTRAMFEPPVWLELQLCMQTGDLTGVKQVADRVAQLAADWPGWRAYQHYTQGCFDRLRGDLAAAKAAFERALAVADPAQRDPLPWLGAWKAAATDYVHVLSDLGRVAEARAFGLHLLERCETLGITTDYAHVRALALAEAKLGEHESAAARLDRLIAQRADIRPSVLAFDLEARARVAILAKDAAAAGHYTRLATEGAAAVGGTASVAKRRRLLDEAELAGVELSVPLSEFEATVLRSKRPDPAASVPSHVLASVTQLSAPEARASQVLTLLTEAAGARAGHLYYARGERLARVATRLAAIDPALDNFAERYVEQWREQTAMTTVFTDVNDSETAMARWTDRNGTQHAIALLQAGPEAACVGLIAFCDLTVLTLNPACRSLCAALAQHLLALGDIEPVGR